MSRIRFLNLIGITTLSVTAIVAIPFSILTSCSTKNPQIPIIVTKDSDFIAIDCSSDILESSIILDVTAASNNNLVSQGKFTFESIFVDNIDVNNKGINLNATSWNESKATLTLIIDPFLLANVIKNINVSNKIATINIKYENTNFQYEADIVTSTSIDLNKIPRASTKIKPIGNYAANTSNPIVYIEENKSENDPNTLRFMEIQPGSNLEKNYGCNGWTVFGTKIENNTISDSSFNAIVDQDTIPKVILFEKNQYEIKNICDFKGDEVVSFIVPEFINAIGKSAFCNCPNLENLDFSHASNLVIINEYSFFNCEKIVNNIIIPENVTFIGDFAFYDCLALTGLDLSQAIKLNFIGEETFSQCNQLTGILTIPASVTSIGNKAFYNGPCFKKIIIDSNNQNYVLANNLGNNCNAVLEKNNGPIFNDTSAIVGGLICGELMFDSNITKISKNLFSKCKGITKLDFSNASNLTVIEEGAFSYCTNLTGDLILPNSINQIMSSGSSTGAFYNCSNLDGSIILPNNPLFKTVKNSVFWGCKNVKSIVLNENIETIEPSAFYNCFSLTALNLQQATNLSSIGKNAFYNCSSLTGTLIIPNKVTVIGTSAFENAKNLTSLNLSSATSLLTIEANAFYSCSNLISELIIPANVTSIGNYAFGESSALTNVKFLQNDATKISLGYYIFGLNALGTKNSNIAINIPNGSIDSWQNVASITDKLGINSKAQIIEV